MKELSKSSRDVAAPSDAAGYRAIKEEAALVERTDGGILRLTGRDPLGMLNAILTNTVPPGAARGAYALLLNPKGRVLTDLRVLKSGDAVLVVTGPEGADAAREALGRYAPFSRVKLEDLSGTWSMLGLYGPRAKEKLEGPELAEHETARVDLAGGNLLAAGVATPAAGYDLLGPPEAVVRAGEELASRGAIPVGPGAYETARIATGVPRFGADLTPENFPGEVGILDRAVDFAKGCYPGQETVARMRYRGHPNKTLYRFSIPPGHTPPDKPILQDGKTVGSLTSVAPLSIGGHTPALGYLSRKTDPDAPLTAGDVELRILGEVG